MYRQQSLRKNGRKKVAVSWTSYTCHIGFPRGILRNSSYTKVSYPFHHKHYFNNLHLQADCYLFPLLCSFQQESLLTDSIKKIKHKLFLINKNGPYGPIVLQGYHEKEEFKLRKDYETKSSFTLPSCKAEYKARYRDKGLHLNVTDTLLIQISSRRIY